MEKEKEKIKLGGDKELLPSDKERKKGTELFEIYKLHCDFADKVSARRGETNKFYLSVFSGLFALLGGIIGFANETTIPLICMGLGVFGVVFSIIWWLNIEAYRQLNSGKFDALYELEDMLEYPFYKREWELLGQRESEDAKGKTGKEQKSKKKYWGLSKVEKMIPIATGIIYFLVFITGILLEFL